MHQLKPDNSLEGTCVRGAIEWSDHRGVCETTSKDPAGLVGE